MTAILDQFKPLWLPEGSIRAILALSVLGAYTYGCIRTGNYEALGLIAVMIAKDYFQVRDK